MKKNFLKIFLKKLLEDWGNKLGQSILKIGAIDLKIRQLIGAIDLKIGAIDWGN